MPRVVRKAAWRNEKVAYQPPVKYEKITRTTRFLELVLAPRKDCNFGTSKCFALTGSGKEYVIAITEAKIKF